MKAKLYKGKVIIGASDFLLSNPNKAIAELYKLCDEIKKFEFNYGFVTRFLERRRNRVRVARITTRKNSDMVTISWNLQNRKGEVGNFSLILSRGLEARIKFLYDYNEDSGKVTNREDFLKEIENFVES